MYKRLRKKIPFFFEIKRTTQHFILLDLYKITEKKRGIYRV